MRDTKEDNSFAGRLQAAVQMKSLRQQAGSLLKRQSRRVEGCPHKTVVHFPASHPRYGDSLPHFSSLPFQDHDDICTHHSVLGGPGISPEYRMPAHRRAPSKTGTGSFQLYKRVLVPGERQQCEAFTKRRGGMAGSESRCKKQSEANAKRCKTHGGAPRTSKASSGLLVALKLEEMPVLLCDR